MRKIKSEEFSNVLSGSDSADSEVVAAVPPVVVAAGLHSAGPQRPSAAAEAVVQTLLSSPSLRDHMSMIILSMSDSEMSNCGCRTVVVEVRGGVAEPQPSSPRADPQMPRTTFNNHHLLDSLASLHFISHHESLMG